MLGLKLDVKAKISEWRRVLQVARKPDREEMLSSSKICMLGIALIGFIGFAIFILFAFIGL
jgi:protein translocase SEC61 complex gamma subunit